ncbi:hypothetical protein K3495_g1345 [Podosphaera aphanis]|nr:hypothetical protein K3495_g1345 [Podosphaera aphanis]
MKVMTAVQNSFGLRDNVSFTSSSLDHANASFKPSTPKVIVQGSDTRFAPSHPQPLPEFVFPARKLPVISTPPSYSRRSNPRTQSLICLGSNEKDIALDNMLKNYSPLFTNGHCDSEPVSPRSGLQDKYGSDHISTENRPRTDKSVLDAPSKNNDTPILSLPPIPSGRSRGHAHRRSAAISSGDLSILLKPNYSLRVGSSLPNSPKLDLHAQNNSPNLASSFSVNHEEANNPSIGSGSIKSAKTTRVEFSDDIQIIPRPLSMSSYDAASTIRSEHSISNSLSSTFSIATSTNPSSLKLDCFTFPSADRRPHTAEPISDREEFLMGHAPKISESLPHLQDKNLTLSQTSAFSPVLNMTGTQTYHENCIPGDRTWTSDSAIAFDPDLSKMNCQPRRSSFNGKPTKKQKKVKSWAGSILSRKARQRSQKKQKHPRPPPTPPVSSSVLDDAQASSKVTGVVIDTTFHSESETDYTSWKSRKLLAQDEPISPVIDLDAALGPFNTPTSNNPESFRRGSNKKKAMHSAAGLGGFSGPGMHYHRRAESAPEFENPRFGLHRLGSSSTMAMEDVFEEDEDDLWDKANESDRQVNLEAGEDEHESDFDLGSPTEVGPHERKNSTSKRVSECQTSRISVDEAKQTDMKSPQSNMSFIDLIKRRKSAGSFETFSAIIHKSDSQEKSRQEICPIKIPCVSLQMPYPNPTPTSSRSAVTQSPFPSPLSPLSYDTQFISTAPSSTTDDQGFESLLLGEPGPELRMSVDDLPSLTSTESTMTRESSFNPNFFNPRFRDGQRSASFSTTSANRKRSSIASLSRLISSAHGERSKLAIESRAPSYCEGVSQHKSSSKTKRISRLIKFWRKSEDFDR